MGIVVYDSYMDRLIKLVAKELSIDGGLIQSPGRRKEFVYARSIIVRCARGLGYSYPAIARSLGRDHTTIIHSYESSENDEDILKKVADIMPFLASLKPNNAITTKLVNDRNSKYSIYRHIYDKYEGKCAICSFSSVVQVCHIVPRAKGGGDQSDNLILLCPSHHEMFDRGLLFIKDVNNIPIR